MFGTRVAVLAGDFLFAQSSWFLANLDNMEVGRGGGGLRGAARRHAAVGLSWGGRRQRPPPPLASLQQRHATSQARRAPGLVPLPVPACAQVTQLGPKTDSCSPSAPAPGPHRSSSSSPRSSPTLPTARSARRPPCLTPPSTCSATWTSRSGRRPPSSPPRAAPPPSSPTATTRVRARPRGRAPVWHWVGGQLLPRPERERGEVLLPYITHFCRLPAHGCKQSGVPRC